jgi:uncharacterized protein YkwD
MQRLIEQINRSRIEGLHCPGAPTATPADPLERSAALDRLASARAQALAATGGLSHGQPMGSALRAEARAIGLESALLAENLARGPLAIEGLLQAWLASPPHCANLADRRYAAVGLACAAAPDGSVWVLTLARPR